VSWRIIIFQQSCERSVKTKYAGRPRELALFARIDVMLLREDTTMRWKFSGSGHDPRQIDLLAIFALLVIIGGAYVYFAHYAATPQNTTAFVVPSQSVRW
jgi:hypothetical protein